MGKQDADIEISRAGTLSIDVPHKGTRLSVIKPGARFVSSAWKSAKWSSAQTIAPRHVRDFDGNHAAIRHQHIDVLLQRILVLVLNRRILQRLEDRVHEHSRSCLPQRRPDCDACYDYSAERRQPRRERIDELQKLLSFLRHNRVQILVEEMRFQRLQPAISYFVWRCRACNRRSGRSCLEQLWASGGSSHRCGDTTRRPFVSRFACLSQATGANHRQKATCSMNFAPSRYIRLDIGPSESLDRLNRPNSHAPMALYSADHADDATEA